MLKLRGFTIVKHMHQDRWRDVVGQIKDNFEVEEYEVTTSEEDGGTTLERLIFESPLGKVKMEFLVRPKVLDKKITYSNRIGSDSIIEYVYDPVEKSCQLLVYRWSEANNDWLPFDAQNLGF